MKTSLDGLWHFTFEDRVMNWSQGMFQIFCPEDQRPMNLSGIHRLIHPLDKFKWELAINQASLGGSPSLFDSLMILPDGRNIWVRHTVKSFLKDGNPIGLEGICTDITDLKVMELERKIDLRFR